MVVACLLICLSTNLRNRVYFCEFLDIKVNFLLLYRDSYDYALFVKVYVLSASTVWL